MTPQLNLEDVEQWFYMLHGDCPGYSVVSSNVNWTGRAVDVNTDGWPARLLDYVTQLDRSNVPGTYLRVTTVGDVPAPGSRGKSADSVALPTLWLDMDIAGPGHKPIPVTPANPNPLPLPPDEETCRQIVAHSGVPDPTCWVHSGGGVYPYWFFKEPVKLLTPEDIEHWNDASRRLHEQVYLTAKEMGWHYGRGTHDVARVLRIPGTVNRKIASAPTQARYLWQDEGGATFFPDELDFPTTVDTAAPVERPRERIITSTPSPSSTSGLRPGDDYNQRGDVLGEVLLPAGWQIHSRRGAELFLTRPGKDRRDGMSASLGYENSANLYVWSTDTGLPVQEPLSPFYLFAFYQCAGDFKAASTELRRLGYGDVTPLPAGSPLPSQAQMAGDMAMIMGGGYEGGDSLTTQKAAPATPPPATPWPAAGQQDTPDPVGPVNANGLPWIDVTDEVTATFNILRDFGSGPSAAAFRFHGEVVYIPGLDPQGMKRPHLTKQLAEGIVRLDGIGFRTFMFESFAFLRYDKEGKPRKIAPAALMAAGVHATLKSGRGGSLRELKGISRTPIIRPDGSICDTPGYDDVTQLIYLPDPGMVIPEVPENPSEEDVAKARGVIEYMLTDFPFVTHNDYLNYVGFLLTPMLLSVVDTPIKMGILGAHQPGSGKTLLANILQTIHGGTLMPGLKSGTDEEIRKQVMANLRNSDAPVSLWDNVSGRLDSPVLDALLTTRTWRDRVLGQSAMMDLPNNKLWLVTGNNLQVGSDLSRRVTWCMIDPNMPNPESRHNFTIPNIYSWVRDNKGSILWSLLTLIQAWSRAGGPTWCEKSDQFCGQVGVINGILKVGGFNGQFDADESRQQVESAGSLEWGDLFEGAYSVFATNDWTLHELLSRIGSGLLENSVSPLPASILPTEVIADFHQGNMTLVARKIGIRLGMMNNSFVGGFQVKRNPQRTRQGYRWSLFPVVRKKEEREEKRNAPPRARATPPADLAQWKTLFSSTPHTVSRELFTVPAGWKPRTWAEDACGTDDSPDRPHGYGSDVMPAPESDALLLS